VASPPQKTPAGSQSAAVGGALHMGSPESAAASHKPSEGIAIYRANQIL
jgi:hypothetical protein